MIGLEDEINIMENKTKGKSKGKTNSKDKTKSKSKVKTTKATNTRVKIIKTPVLKVKNDVKRKWFNQIKELADELNKYTGAEFNFVDVYGGDGIIDYWLKTFIPGAKIYYNDINGLADKINSADNSYLNGIKIINMDTNDTASILDKFSNMTNTFYILDSYNGYDYKMFDYLKVIPAANIIFFDNTATTDYINTFKYFLPLDSKNIKLQFINENECLLINIGVIIGKSKSEQEQEQEQEDKEPEQEEEDDQDENENEDKDKDEVF